MRQVSEQPVYHDGRASGEQRQRPRVPAQRDKNEHDTCPSPCVVTQILEQFHRDLLVGAATADSVAAAATSVRRTDTGTDEPTGT